MDHLLTTTMINYFFVGVGVVGLVVEDTVDVDVRTILSFSSLELLGDNVGIVVEDVCNGTLLFMPSLDIMFDGVLHGDIANCGNFDDDRSFLSMLLSS